MARVIDTPCIGTTGGMVESKLMWKDFEGTYYVQPALVLLYILPVTKHSEEDYMNYSD